MRLAVEVRHLRRVVARAGSEIWRNRRIDARDIGGVEDVYKRQPLGTDVVPDDSTITAGSSSAGRASGASAGAAWKSAGMEAAGCNVPPRFGGNAETASTLSLIHI